jgi:putative two-component system response regulator
VLQIVDVYDALTTERPYKRALSIEEALRMMRKEIKKGWWDPKVFDAFERMVKTEEVQHRGLARAAAAD